MIVRDAETAYRYGGGGDLVRGENKSTHLVNTEFWQRIMEDVFGSRQGGGVILLDAENAAKGAAKTSAAIALGRALAYRFGYDLQPEDALIAGPEYVRRYQQHPGKEQPSVLIADELVGGGAGDARRAMSGANIKLGRAFQLLRKKRVITIATLPDWGEADTRLQKYSRYRVHCLEKPLGTFKAYKIITDFNAKSGGVKTAGLGPDDDTTRRIQFPDMKGRNDRFYRLLEGKKDDLLDEEDFDISVLQEDDEEDDEGMTEDEIRREERIETAIRLYQPWDDDSGRSYEKVADVLPEFGREWVGQRIREWKRGDHRDIVADPTDGSE